MTLDKTSFLILFCFILIFSISILANNVYEHEKLHEAISYNYGCINSTIVFFDITNKGMETYFKCNEYYNRTTEMQIKENELHSINEIVSYNVITIIMCFMMVCISVLFIFTLKK